MTTKVKAEQSLMTKIMLAFLSGLIAVLAGWVWQLDADRHEQTAMLTKLDRVVVDLGQATRRLSQVTLNAQAINELNTAVTKMAKWQEEWPRTGLLQADVEQNANIQFLRAELSRTNASLDKLQQGLSQLQLKVAASNIK